MIDRIKFDAGGALVCDMGSRGVTITHIRDASVKTAWGELCIEQYIDLVKKSVHALIVKNFGLFYQINMFYDSESNEMTVLMSHNYISMHWSFHVSKKLEEVEGRVTQELVGFAEKWNVIVNKMCQNISKLYTQSKIMNPALLKQGAFIKIAEEKYRQITNNPQEHLEHDV
jgi:hypothetical protein